MTTENGGPAFPVHPNTNPSGDSAGMKLRDWFAGQIMAAAMVSATNLNQVPDELLVEASGQAYRVADAMLEARGA
ncbi:hypothetical protein [Aurantimonas coralicida]|uniref:hypothetical protein n=1 Tax=Aurantimonas coralicida TaxID=182270 RepID=UPI001E563756|nr:hypothetical protein [Aurantimonas coralicida]MCD1645208.1 hypothetical protein [Aurantimonas coralicida]